ncbi:MAG TPA: SH3 domain-containing protein [Vicinamibacterales bacterium]|nr:SH3 domain-containing protein [Vicinamibacterales bacterium]
MPQTFAVSAVLIAVTAVLTASGARRQKTLPFCADGGHKAAPARLLPVDEASRQPEFFTFRARLQAAVAAKDLDAVVAASDPNIKLGFGGEDGTALLRENLSKPKSDGLWKEIARVLALGGAFRGPSTFHAPYVSSNWPDGADSFECAAIIGGNVIVRRDPAPDAAVVTRTSYSIVRVLSNRPGFDDWGHIRLSNGQEGFVRNDFLMGATGLRAIFALTNGQWRMESLVAGD